MQDQQLPMQEEHSQQLPQKEYHSEKKYCFGEPDEVLGYAVIGMDDDNPRKHAAWGFYHAIP